MKRFYCLLLALGLAVGPVLVVSAQNQAWRPFRPGLIYTFSTPGSTAAYTLRLDSAYATASGDSAWAFNRVLRATNGSVPTDPGAFFARKSRNNLFGQRLTWRPGSAEYVLETLAEGTAQAASSLRLRPRAAVGSTWAASTSPAITATLTGRGLQTVAGQADTVATISLSTGQALQLSRRLGLVAGPQWLGLSGSPAQWTLAALPATLAQSPYNPARIFDLQPGDELGYRLEAYAFSSLLLCESGALLRRIVSRTVVNDSLIYTLRGQTQTTTSGAPGCSPAGSATSLVTTSRWAFSVRTGQSQQFPMLGLLTGETRSIPPTTGNFSPVDYGRGLATPIGMGLNCAGSQLIVYDHTFRQLPSNPNGYWPRLDYNGRTNFSATLGVGEVYSSRRYEVTLAYYRLNRNGGIVTCGSPAPYVGLLPTRAAQAAAVATLHPNPATEQATLRFAAPVPAGATLALTDALGRLVWQSPLLPGQTTAIVPLAGRQAGLYLLQLRAANAAPLTWKLVRE